MRKGSAVGDDHQAHGLVEDDGFERSEAENSDQQRQTKFSTAEADKASEERR